MHEDVEFITETVLPLMQASRAVFPDAPSKHITLRFNGSVQPDMPVTAIIGLEGNRDVELETCADFLKADITGFLGEAYDGFDLSRMNNYLRHEGQMAQAGLTPH